MVPLARAGGSSGPVAQADEEIGTKATDGFIRCTHRHDLDESGGEVMEIAVFPSATARAAAEAAACASARLPGAPLRGEAHVTARFQPFEGAPLFLRVYRQPEGGSMVSKEAFTVGESLIPLLGDMVEAPPPSTVPDRVALDLQDIPRVLSLVRADWKEENGRNRRTAAELFRMIKEQVHKCSVWSKRSVQAATALLHCPLDIWSFNNSLPSHDG